MSENLTKILSAPSIEGETIDEQIERMSIPKEYSDVMVINELVKVYKNNPKLNGTSENIISRLSGSKVVTQENAQANSSVEANKIQDSNIKKETKMAEVNFDAAMDAVNNMQDLKDNAAKNAGAQAAPKAPKVVKLEAGAEQLKQKAEAALNNSKTNGYKVSECYAKKDSKKALVEDYARATKKPIYSNGHQVNGIVGYLVKPGRGGVVDPAVLTTRVNAILDDIRAKFGWNDETEACTNPAYNTAIKDLVTRLTNASQIITETVREAHKPAGTKLADDAYVLQAGNTSFLVDEAKLSDKKSIQGEKLTTGDILVSSKLSERMFKDMVPIITLASNQNVIFEAGARKVTNKKGESKFSYYVQIKGRDGITNVGVANKLVAGKVSYIKAEAKIDNLTYQTTNKAGKVVKKAFKIMLFVPIFGTVQHVANVNCPELYLKENKKEATGSKAVNKDYFNDKEYLENKVNKFANQLKEISLG